MSEKKEKAEKKPKAKREPRAKKPLAPLPHRPTPAEQRKELIDSTMPLSIFTKFEVEEIKMKKKHWFLKVWADLILDKSYHRYKMTMQFNEQPYEDAIYDMEEELRGSLFGTERVSRAQLNKRIGEKRNQMNKLKKECYTIEFHANVEELKYKDRGTMILCTIPDEIIAKLNEQKSRFSYYELKLEPTYA